MDTKRAFGIAADLINKPQPFTVVMNNGCRTPCSIMLSTNANLTGGGGVIEVVSGEHRDVIVIDVSDIRDIILGAPASA